MEFIETVNGFGRVKLNVAEQQLLTRLEDIISGNGIKYSLGELNQPTGQYELVMHDLFPMIPMITAAGVWGSKFQNVYSAKKIKESTSYQEFPPAKELIIGSRLGIGGYSTDVDLRILLPREGYFMSVVLSVDYKSGHQSGYQDDIVRILGARENPVLVGTQRIKHKESTIPVYGLAEVPHLRTTLKLYDKAADLLRNMEETIGVNREELQELRKDSLKHPNIAVRKLSAIEYHKTLEDLISQ